MDRPLPPPEDPGADLLRAGLSLPSLSRLLGMLYVCGGSVAVGWLQLPHGRGRGDDVVLSMALLAIALGVGLNLLARRITAPLLHTVLALIQLVIAVAYVSTGRPDSDLRLYFLWAAPYAALTFGRRALAAHLAWTGVVGTVSVLLMLDAPYSFPRAGLLLLVSTLMAVGVVVGVSAEALRRAEALQRRQASVDALTELGNRRTLLEALAATPPGAALVLLDLDGFKAVNDRYGHARGDELLRDVGGRLREVAREGDVVCRLGGDEFALVVADVPEELDALALAQRVSDAVAVPADDGLEGRVLLVRASTGVRLLGAGGLTPTEALRDADLALYTSKAARRATPVLWREGMRREHEAQDELAEELRAALRDGQQLRLVYQPVVDAGTLRVRGVEALARWRHPERGDVPPDVFVGCAERSGLAGELTRWVLHTACAEARRWPVGLDGTTINLALNISAVQLADLQVVEDVRCALATSGLAAGDLVLEVTETSQVVDLDLASRTLTALAQLGAGLALDDFGTGHSSLTHVQALPFHILKIDRTFVAAAAAGDRRALATIAAVGALAGQLDVDVVAEGVEDLEQLPALRRMGAGYAQGYGLSRPVEAEVVRAALTPPRDGGWVLGVPLAVPLQRG